MSKVSEYSEALALALHTKGASHADAVLDNTRSILKRSGKEAMYPFIVRGALRLLERKERSGGAEVILASEGEGSALRDAIAHDLSVGGAHEYKTRIDHSLIKGYVVKAGGLRADRSVRKKLIELYGVLTETK